MKRTEHTQKWLDALRSGEYEQTRLTLFNDEGYCCIGVAAHILGACDINNKEAGYQAVKVSMGLAPGEKFTLMTLNDQQKKTFPEIADAIEEMLDE